MKFILPLLVLCFTNSVMAQVSHIAEIDSITYPKLVMDEVEVKVENEKFDKFLEENMSIIIGGRMGDVVGNGGGIIEGQTAFFYNSLPKIITNALELEANMFTETEKKALLKILEIAQDNTVDQKVLFLDSNKFFLDKNDGQVRTAKTGFSPRYQIYMNRELLYKNIKQDFSPLATLLVHELGHQAGIKSHSFLENIGSKVQKTLVANSESIQINLDNKPLTIDVYNYYSQGAWADLVVKYNGVINNLPKIPHDQLKGFCGNATPIDYKLSNIHWMMRPTNHSYYYFAVTESWADITCMNAQGDLSQVDAFLIVEMSLLEDEIFFTTRVYKDK